MHARSQRQQAVGAAGSVLAPRASLEPSPASEVIHPQAVREFLSWRILDVSTKILTHQPLEPSRALANRMYNDRAILLQAAASHAPSPSPSTAAAPPPLPTAAEKRTSERKSSSSTSGRRESQQPPVAAPYIEGGLYRQWTQARLAPFGLDALNAFQLPAIALATSTSTDEMLATVVALLHRQCRATAGERKALPPPLSPLFHDGAEEVDVAVAVPFLAALAEQELRGVAPGFTPRVILACTLVALRVLLFEKQREHAADDAAADTADAAAHRTPVLLAGKLACVGLFTETHQLGHHLCRCVNRGLLLSGRRGSRSGKSSLSSSVRVSAVLEGSRRSQSRASPGQDWPCDAEENGLPAPPPLSPADLDSLVDALFLPSDEPSTSAAHTLTAVSVSARSLHKALLALTAALWAVYEVAIPLAALRCTRAGHGGAGAVAVTDGLDALLAVLRTLLRAGTQAAEEAVPGANLDAAQAMLMEDFARVLRSVATAGGSSLSSFRAVPTNLSALQRGASARTQSCTPLVASLWMQSLDWVLQVTEAAVTAEYQKDLS